MREDEAQVAAAVEGANGVPAGSVATGVSLTLINIYTHCPVIVGFESVVTNAVEASNSVDTLPMAADIGNFLTFIPISAAPRGREPVARFAVTAVAPSCVHTLCILLANWSVLALINIFTDQELVIVEETHRTLASEAANHVYTDPIFTHSRNLSAFININW